MANAVDFVLFAVLMTINLAIGLYFSFCKGSQQPTSDDVFLGSRRLRMVPLAMSTLASLVSALGIIGLGAHFYAYGFHYVWSLITSLVVLPFVMYVVVPTLYKLRVTSVFQVSR